MHLSGTCQRRLLAQDPKGPLRFCAPKAIWTAITAIGDAASLRVEWQILRRVRRCDDGERRTRAKRPEYYFGDYVCLATSLTE